MTKKIDWSFKAVNPADYEMIISMRAENRLLLVLFGKARTAMLRKKNVAVSGTPERIDSFDVEPKFYNALQTILRPVLRDAHGACKLDGIETLTHFVKKASFERDKDRNWSIVVTFEGQYADKR
jgi:hypothetical protein